MFIGVLFEFKVALEMISISNGQEQQSQTVSVRINGCAVTFIPFLMYKYVLPSFCALFRNLRQQIWCLEMTVTLKMD